MAETRKIAAILVADVVGYSRLAGMDEERTLARLRGLRDDLIDPAIDAHRGRIVKRTGDGSIIEFRSAVDAVRCAIEVQNGMIERNSGLPPERRIEFRVGIHLGDVVEEADGDLMGGGVYWVFHWASCDEFGWDTRCGPMPRGQSRHDFYSRTRECATLAGCCFHASEICKFACGGSQSDAHAQIGEIRDWLTEDARPWSSGPLRPFVRHAGA